LSSSSTAPPPTALSSLSLHDALPISHNWIVHGNPLWPVRTSSLGRQLAGEIDARTEWTQPFFLGKGSLAATLRSWYGHYPRLWPDRKSTRLNSSHGSISYAVFCLKKK